MGSFGEAGGGRARVARWVFGDESGFERFWRERERAEERKASRGAIRNSRDCAQSYRRASEGLMFTPCIYGFIGFWKGMFEFRKH